MNRVEVGSPRDPSSVPRPPHHRGRLGCVYLDYEGPGRDVQERHGSRSRVPWDPTSLLTPTRCRLRGSDPHPGQTGTFPALPRQSTEGPHTASPLGVGGDDEGVGEDTGVEHRGVTSVTLPSPVRSVGRDGNHGTVVSTPL